MWLPCSTGGTCPLGGETQEVNMKKPPTEIRWRLFYVSILIDINREASFRTCCGIPYAHWDTPMGSRPLVSPKAQVMPAAAGMTAFRLRNPFTVKRHANLRRHPLHPLKRSHAEAIVIHSPQSSFFKCRFHALQILLVNAY